jgi:membrane protease YdiL (CAAX protease family)
VDDRPGEAVPPPAPPAPPDPLRRYRALQVISILLVVAGFGLILLAILLAPGALDLNALPARGRAITTLAALAGGALAVVSGLVLNAVRAVVVREALPPSRYRGPSIIVLVMLAQIASLVGSVGAIGDLQAIEDGGPISVGGALLILTVTQAGLLAAAIAFVAIPNALAGVRLLPGRGALRSVGIGLLLAVPAWICAAILGYILTRVLELLGQHPEAGVVEEAIARVDPTVLLLAIVLVAPVAEEIFFRGVVLNAWLREYGERRAVLGSAALFAAIHANPNGWAALVSSLTSVVPIFGLGIALALVYRRSGSLLASIALHAGFNAISLTLALLDRFYGWNIST